MSTSVEMPPALTTPPEMIGPLFRIPVEQYLEIIRAGILPEDETVELLEGVLVNKMGKNPPHVVANNQLHALLSALLPVGWHASVQNPIRLTYSVPEPDCFVVRGVPKDYETRHPDPADVALIVEVAGSSLDRDRGIKTRMYARDGIITYWIVNLVDHCIEVYTGPSGPIAAPAYAACTRIGPEGELPVVLDGREVGRIPAGEILPSA